MAARGDQLAPTGPPWGWRIGLHMDTADRFRLLVHNVSPGRDEMLAGEAANTRA